LAFEITINEVEEGLERIIISYEMKITPQEFFSDYRMQRSMGGLPSYLILSAKLSLRWWSSFWGALYRFTFEGEDICIVSKSLDQCSG
jgi:hypothetical protein